ncbi:tyrosine-type recombinase/integrase [Vagococcus fluvialis]|jgi:integrase|uniref:tyrosine-type recombinase/integrase n=1 Tax=Vagococcus fluvialis TaxID=2738 RepID=UPI00281E8C3E|nr:site-specific integrase [Vagococcus sp.]
MAQFKQYELKNGSKKWLFKTYLGIDEVTGKQLTTTRRGFDTLKEAKLEEKRLQHEVIENGFNRKKVITFQELYDTWLEQYRLSVKPSSVAIAQRYAKNQILPVFAKIKLDKLTVSFCQKIVNGWHKEYKQYSYLRKQTSQILKYGVSIEVIKDNPMAKTTLPRKKEEDKKINFYSKEELNEFLDFTQSIANYKIFTFFRILGYTGMRKSEVLSLQWKDVDFDNQTLNIGKTLAIDEFNKVIIQEPKTTASVRQIYIDQETINILKRWRTAQRQYYFARGINIRDDKQFMFTDTKNRLYYPQIANDWLKWLYRKNKDLKVITPHGFRHTHCSLLFESGVNIQEVQERLGHKDIKTTMNIYTHVTEKAIKKTGDVFAKFMEN